MFINIKTELKNTTLTSLNLGLDRIRFVRDLGWTIWAPQKYEPKCWAHACDYLIHRHYLSLQYHHHDYESDPRSNEHYLSSSENKAWKKFKPLRDLNAWPLWYRCSALPTEPTSQLGAGHYVGSKYMTFIYSKSFNIIIILIRRVRRTKTTPSVREISWSNTKFSKLYHRNCMADSKENL